MEGILEQVQNLMGEGRFDEASDVLDAAIEKTTAPVAMYHYMLGEILFLT